MDMNKPETRAQELKRVLGLRHRPAIYRSEALARQRCERTFAYGRTVSCRSTGIEWIVLGDADADRAEYLVVVPADAARLERAGYEILR